MSIHWPIVKQQLCHLKRTAIVDDRRSYKGVEVIGGALHIARHLEPLNKTKTLGLLLPTSGGSPLGALAGWMLGKTVVPINYLLKPEEMNYIIRDCGCDTVLTVQPMLEFLGGKADECIFGSKREGSGGVEATPTSSVKHLVKVEDISFKGAPPVRWPAGAAEDDLGVLLYTSGTSGKPKGVMLSHGNVRSNIRQIQDYVSFTSDDVMLGVLPQFHSFGLTVLTLLPLMLGLKAVYTARFIPSKIIKLIREHRPTVLVAIPSMYNALLHAKDVTADDFKSLRYIVSGGEPLPQAVFDGYRERFNVTINEGYGLTETSPVTNWCRPDEFRRGSVGGPVGKGATRVRERIVSLETGKDLPAGEDGEVRIAGPNVMKGYYNLPTETSAAFDEQGYFKTGDIGRMDADGHLFITGRLKEMLIVGGENVFPREIEEVLNAHPSVKDSGVVGKQDPMRGEMPVAFVEMKDDPTGAAAAEGGAKGGGTATEGAPAPKIAFDEKALLKWCRERLAGYKVPDEIRVIDALPRNPTGKVMRRELKAILAKG